MALKRACSVFCTRPYLHHLRSDGSSSHMMTNLPRTFLPSFSAFWERFYFSFQLGWCRYSVQSSSLSQQNPSKECEERKVEIDEIRKLLRLVNVEALKKRLNSETREYMPYADLLRLCQSTGVASSDQDAKDFVQALNESGVVFIFRNNAYLYPQRIAEFVSNAVPLSLTSEDDPRLQELTRLRREKEEIDKIAHRKVRTVLWSGVGFLTVQTVLFIRLTFWELSWDVMEPITFFVTSGGFIAGYTYFLITSRDPTYQDFSSRLFYSKQKKLIQRKNFNIQRLIELEKECTTGLNDFKLQ